MKPKNLLSLYQGDRALEQLNQNHRLKGLTTMKPQEVNCLDSLCTDLRNHQCGIKDLDGFFAGYSIPQISREFDLLRFGEHLVLDVELKCHLINDLSPQEKMEKIRSQLRRNQYYLQFLQRGVRLFCYVEPQDKQQEGECYEYDPDADRLNTVGVAALAQCLRSQTVDYAVDPDREFVPSKYLVSPFNATQQFLKNDYFLTDGQQSFKADFYRLLAQAPFCFAALSGDAGTGKTLLLYDIAKERMAAGKKVIIVHCGILNQGHLALCQAGWQIFPVKDILQSVVPALKNGSCDLLLVDEAQRIRTIQLQLLIQECRLHSIPVFFSYDVKQFLKTGETTDIAQYLAVQYPGVPCCSRHLTSTIRTNRNLASFIQNMRSVGSSADSADYRCVTIEYLNDEQTCRQYLGFLRSSGWMPLTFTASAVDCKDPYHLLSTFCNETAHQVIGQEFSRVAVVLDQHFWYNGNQLMVSDGYYSGAGMLYQLLTRAVSELKIIVLNNPALYRRLLEIKNGH